MNPDVSFRGSFSMDWIKWSRTHVWMRQFVRMCMCYMIECMHGGSTNEGENWMSMSSSGFQIWWLIKFGDNNPSSLWIFVSGCAELSGFFSCSNAQFTVVFTLADSQSIVCDSSSIPYACVHSFPIHWTKGIHFLHISLANVHIERAIFNNV